MVDRNTEYAICRSYGTRERICHGVADGSAEGPQRQSLEYAWPILVLPLLSIRLFNRAHARGEREEETDLKDGEGLKLQEQMSALH